MSENGKGTPPVGEELHMPGPSVLPLLVAAALTLLVLMVTHATIFWVIATVILLFVIGLWVRDARREHLDLPAHHEH